MTLRGRELPARPRARTRAEKKEIRTNPLESLDTKSGKQRVAARGKAISATGMGRPPMAVAFGKGARHMCSLYVSVKAAVPIEETGRRVMPLSGPDGRVESWPTCPYGKHAIGFGRDRRRADQQVR